MWSVRHGSIWNLHAFGISRLRCHCALDGLNVGAGRTLGPCRIGFEHRRDGVAMLFRDPQRVVPDHQIPAHGRMPGAVGFAVADHLQPVQRLTPTGIRVQKIADRFAVAFEEELFVMDSTLMLELRAERELAFQHE